jgi:two-component system, sensor histidine kinase and response regulator
VSWLKPTASESKSDPIMEPVTNKEIKENNMPENAIHHSGIFLWVLNNRGDVVTLNLNVSDRLGYFKDSMTGNSFFTFGILPDFNLEQVTVNPEACGMLYKSETSLRTADGHIIPVFCMVERILLPDDSYIFISAIETGKIQPAEKAASDGSNTETLKNYRNNIFSVISHDLRNPFNTILGYCELLNNCIISNDKSKSLFYSKIIHDATEQSLNYLVRLLDWGRLQYDHPPFRPLYFRIDTQVKQVIKFCGFQAESKKVKIEVEIENGLEVYGDQNMVRTILVNLISNAIKFSKKGKKIVIKAVPSLEGIHFSVADEGVGMKKPDISKLFDLEKPFTTNGTEDEEGSGMGLAICKSYVDLHGGKIWAESTYGKGSVFSFVLPGSRTHFQN